LKLAMLLVLGAGASAGVARADGSAAPTPADATREAIAAAVAATGVATPPPASEEPTALALPDLRFLRRGEMGVLTVLEPPGEHLAPDAPARLWLHVDRSSDGAETLGAQAPAGSGSPSGSDQSVVDLSTNGSSLYRGVGVALGTSGPLSLQGEISLSLCANEGGACRIVHAAFHGALDHARGTVPLVVTPAVEDVEEDKAEQATQAPLSPDEAFRRAGLDGRLVLLDFYATWCSPCNLLAAQILDDPADAPLLEPFWIARVDVDTPESWSFKSRYHVTGYPTLVVTTADGAEVDRQVGSPSDGDTGVWLHAMSEGVEPIDEIAGRALHGNPPFTPNEAGMAARRLAASGRLDAARAALKVAGEGVEKHIAMLSLDRKKEEVLWLATNGQADLPDWVWLVPNELWKDPAILAAMRPAIRKAILSADPAMAAELLDLLADATQGEESRTYVCAAAALLHGTLVGEPAADRGHWTFLAELYQKAGETDEALDILNKGIAAYPNEFTFYFALGETLHDLGRNEQAINAAQAALTTSYGDTTLRAAMLCARILADLDRKDEALKLIDAVEAKTRKPPAELDVRTHRYLKELEKTRQDLQKGHAAPPALP
jgi:tetratricopeptide (TPR) repeat protein/thiol-disulfide isomerase/thioredoxin